MASILEEFAYGNLTREVQFFNKDTAYKQAIEFATYHETKLLEQLGAEDKKILQNYIAMQEEVAQLTAVKNFMYGFKLGLLMTAETFIGLEDLYVNGNNV